MREQRSAAVHHLRRISVNGAAGTTPAAMIAAAISGLAFAGCDHAEMGPPPTSPSALEGAPAIVSASADLKTGLSMKLNRTFVTPFLAFIFVSVGFSGVLMFFHLADGFTEVLHEVLGLTFVLFAFLHVAINWKSMKSHFGKRNFFIAAAAVAVLSVGLIILERAQIPADLIIMERVARAPISDSFRVLEIDHIKAAMALNKKGIGLEGAGTIEDIWLNNDSSPEEVVETLLYEAK
ncbi:DUF4405 domain-containing protein [Sorangium sp. So ce341]|uniref:DUF4405 domain-containing protein n=1 Tax=Sorangium sp. So ce341 TaxID=3133302 RepID=UPI003F5FE88D